MPTICKTFPIRIVSPNVQEHWTKRHKRNKMLYLLIKQLWWSDLARVETPCRIELIRKGNRLLDGDNLVFSFKGIRDTLCQLITGKRRGIGDDGPEFTWVYTQKKSKIYEVEIEISW
jgi:hypothetical protein